MSHARALEGAKDWDYRLEGALIRYISLPEDMDLRGSKGTRP